MSLASDPVQSKSSRRMGPVPRPKKALKKAVEPVDMISQNHNKKAHNEIIFISMMLV